MHKGIKYEIYIGISISINISVSVSASVSVCVSISIYHPCLTYLSREKVESNNWAQWLHHAKGDCGRFLCPAICERCSAWNTPILCCSKNGGIHEAKDTNCGEFFFYVFSWLFGWIVRPALLLSYTIYTRGRPGRLWFIRGRPFDFGRGGRVGVWMISEKISYRTISRKKEKYIYISWRILCWYKSYTFVRQRKNSYPNQITHTPPPQKSNGRPLKCLQQIIKKVADPLQGTLQEILNVKFLVWASSHIVHIFTIVPVFMTSCILKNEPKSAWRHT